jgi:hypothetical protein
MAKKLDPKKVVVTVTRPFMARGVMVPAAQGERGKQKGVHVELSILFARELIANGKAVLATESKNFELPKEEKSFEDELADL